MKIPTLSATMATLLLAAHLIPVDAAAKDAARLADCVTLSPEHQGTRFGSQYLLVRDGGSHYRLEFSGSCGALNSGAVTISTQKEPHRLCPTGTLVSSKSGACQVRGVSLIDADEFDRYARRSRR